MDESWVTPLISALAALAGALIGGSAVLMAGRFERQAQGRRELLGAVASYLQAAENLFVWLGEVVEARREASRNRPPWILRPYTWLLLRLGIEAYFTPFRLYERFQPHSLHSRTNAVEEAYSAASTRLRIVAPLEMLSAIDALHDVVYEARRGYTDELARRWIDLRDEVRRQARAL